MQKYVHLTRNGHLDFTAPPPNEYIFAIINIAKVSFSCATWALDYLQDQGGSAYLPEHLVGLLLANKTLFLVEGAPLFSRNAYLITNDLVSSEWAWLDGILYLIQIDLSIT